MKNRILSLLLIPILASCATTPTGTQVAQTAAAIANTALTAYTAYSAATTGTLTPQQIANSATVASNDLNGIAALAQAYVGTGKSPVAAKLVTGANNVALAASVISQLPNVPIQQSTVNTLFQAAAIIGKTPPSASRKTAHKIIVQHRLKGAQRLVFAADNEPPNNMLPKN